MKNKPKGQGKYLKILLVLSMMIVCSLGVNSISINLSEGYYNNTYYNGNSVQVSINTLNDSLIYLPMSETSGTKLVDHNGAILTNVSIDNNNVYQTLDNGIYKTKFDGAQGNSDCTLSNTADWIHNLGDNFSFCYFLEVHNYTSDTYVTRFVGSGNYFVTFLDHNGRFSIDVFGRKRENTYTIPIDEEHHICYVFNNPTDDTLLYVDGVYHDTTAGHNLDNAQGSIATRRFGTRDGESFRNLNGTMRDFRFINTYLTSEEINTIYITDLNRTVQPGGYFPKVFNISLGNNAANSSYNVSCNNQDCQYFNMNYVNISFSPWAYYPFDGNDFQDVNGNILGMTNNGNADFTEDGYFSGGWIFNEGNDRIIRSSHVPQLSKVNNFTIFMWFKAEKTNTMQLLGHSVDTSDRLGIYITTDILRVGLYTGAWQSKSTPFTDTSSFHSVAMVWNGTGTLAYLDGVEITGSETSSTIVNEGFAIGARTDNDNNFDGIIDELIIYNKTLTQAEVITLNSTRWMSATKKQSSEGEGVLSFEIPNTATYGQNPTMLNSNLTHSNKLYSPFTTTAYFNDGNTTTTTTTTSTSTVATTTTTTLSDNYDGLFYYPMEEGTGITTSEYNNLSNDLSIRNYTWQNQSKFNNYSLYSNLLNVGYIKTTSQLAPVLTRQIASCMWINWTNNTGTNYLIRTNPGIAVSLQSNGAMTFIISYTDGSTSFGGTAGDVSLSELTQVCVLYDGAISKIIVNGAIVKTKDDYRATISFSGSQQWQIGQFSDNNNNFKGYIDDFAVFNGTNQTAFIESHLSGSLDSFYSTYEEPFYNSSTLQNSLACWGDSITGGQYISTPDTFNSFCNLTNTEGSYNVTRYYRPGRKSSEMLTYKWNLTPKEKYYDNTLILMGTNDLETSNPVSMQSGYYSNLNNVIPDLLLYNQTVMISTIPPCNYSAYGCYDDNLTKVIQLNDVIRRLSFDYDIGYCDIYQTVFGGVFNTTLFDGTDFVHPNQLAHNNMNSTYIDCFNNIESYDCELGGCYNYTTPPTTTPNPIISSPSKTNVSIDVSVSGIGSLYYYYQDSINVLNTSLATNSFTGLSPNTEYCYQVKQENNSYDNNLSGFSNQLCITTKESTFLSDYCQDTQDKVDGGYISMTSILTLLMLFVMVIYILNKVDANSEASIERKFLIKMTIIAGVIAIVIISFGIVASQIIQSSC